MKNQLRIVLLITLATSTLHAQYVIEYPFLYFQDLYSTTTIGFGYYPLPQPTQSYISTRIRSLFVGFAGLISDPYTDHFRNPAMEIASQKGEVFGDFGSVNDFGRFLIGGFVRSESTMIDASTSLDRLLKRTTSSRSTYTNNYPPLSTTTNEYKSEMNPEGIGGRIAAAFYLSGNNSLGASYEYLHTKNGTRDESSRATTPPSPQTSNYLNDSRSSTDLHTVMVGGKIHTSSGIVSLVCRGVFSTAALTNHYSSFSRYSYSWNTHTADYPTDVKTTAFFLGGTYELMKADEWKLRLLVDFASTSYSTSGSQRSESIDSSYSIYMTSVLGSRPSEGTITDIRAGIGYQRNILNAITCYAGFSTSYIRNSLDATEITTSTIVLPPPNPQQPPETVRTTSKETMDGFDIRLPLAMEIALGNHVSLLGGMEARYRSGESFTERETFGPPPGNFGETGTSEVTQRGLLFGRQFGMRVHHEEYGEIDVVFGKNLTDTSFWSFFLRYFI